MNKNVIEQLKKVNDADLSDFDESTNTYHIKKKTGIKIEIDHCYLMKLKDSIYNNDILWSNWNRGIYPKSKLLKADVSKIMNNMIKVTCIELDETTGEDTDRMWEGWLITSELEIVLGESDLWLNH